MEQTHWEGKVNTIVITRISLSEVCLTFNFPLDQTSEIVPHN